MLLIVNPCKSVIRISIVNSLRNLLTHIVEREFDADKHCGVWIADLQKQCTRSLTCKVSELLNFSDSFWIVTGSI